MLIALLTLCSAISTSPESISLVLQPDRPNELTFPATPARFVRFWIHESSGGEPCLDELEVYAAGSAENLALAARGGKASASSVLAGYAIHQIAHLNDGQYGNEHSWIAAGVRGQWAQIELTAAARISRVVVARDRSGRYRDRVPTRFEVQLSLDGVHWSTVVRCHDVLSLGDGPVDGAALLRYAFACEDATWRKVDPTDPVERVLGQMERMLERFAARGLPVAAERAELAELRRRFADEPQRPTNPGNPPELYYTARLAKRRLFLRDPELAPAQRILFVKRHPYEPSHNYSVILDAQGGPGGGICTLEIPRLDGRLEPEKGKLALLFDAKNGIARDPVLGFDARTIYFAYRVTKQDFFHLWAMNADGSDARQISDGPFHDYFPCPLPDGGLAFISTRCKARFLCWRPQAFVLFRREADGSGIRPLSFANLSEWTPSLLRDGRILWMRSEYVDKGADFGHTLWAIRPDGSYPELIFGNNTPNCYANGHEVPGTSELLCTLVSHGGDLNGPIALVDPQKGRFNPQAVTNITPDVAPCYNMNWARRQCFRDPYPIGRNHFLCSHAPADKFGLYLVDRWGNRELLYLDPALGSMAPLPIRPRPAPPAVPATPPSDVPPEQGRLVVVDVYRGLEPAVRRGQVKYLRLCQEVRADLVQLADGSYQHDHEQFLEWYATPIHKVHGPAGWPSYVAKGDLGLVPVEEDGSANFYAPAGKVLYFQALDEHLTELQRMRSVVQLQAGETRSCIGCHEHRSAAPPYQQAVPLALQRPPSRPQPPPWGAGAFAYEKVVQPVWNRHCLRCHHAQDQRKLDFTGTRDADGVPASYRTLIEQGWVHHFDCVWQKRHEKAQPLTFGSIKSRLWQVLDKGHYDVHLSREDIQRVKTWIDLNCPLWPDYQYRWNRPELKLTAGRWSGFARRKRARRVQALPCGHRTCAHGLQARSTFGLRLYRRRRFAKGRRSGGLGPAPAAQVDVAEELGGHFAPQRVGQRGVIEGRIPNGKADHAARGKRAGHQLVDGLGIEMLHRAARLIGAPAQ